MSEVEIASLVGLHTLDARAEFKAEDCKDDWNDDVPTVFALRLDGLWYWFQEDPCDNYRSCLRLARVAEPGEIPRHALAEFPPRVVEIRHRGQWTRKYKDGDFTSLESDDCIYGVDEQTGLVLFDVGTHEHDDYYPSFVAAWWPDGYAAPWLEVCDVD